MALNPYDNTKDPLYGVQNSGMARLGQSVTPSDSADFANYLVVIVVAAGDVKFLPVNNDTNDPIVMAALPVGYVIPWQVRRIFATGTSATLRTLEKVY